MDIYLPLLAKIGDFKKVEAGAAVKSLNDALTTAGLAIGAILIVAACIKMIIAISSEDSRQKAEATMLASIGILFVSITQVVKMLGVESIGGSTSVNTVASNIITVIANMLTWAGGLLAIFSIFSIAVAIAQENSDSFVGGTKLIGVSIGLLSVGSLASAINRLLLAKNQTASSYASVIAGFLANIATYIGGGLVIVGAFKLVISIREENSRDRDTAIRFFMAGIALIGIRVILRRMGITLS